MIPGNNSNGVSAGGYVWRRELSMTIRQDYGIAWGPMWIFDTVNKSWRLLNGQGGNATKVPHQMGANLSMAFSKDDDVFMLGGDIGYGGAWIFDAYTNNWYLVPVPWGFTSVNKQGIGLTYDTKNKKYLKFGSSYSLRDLWSYDSTTGTWTVEPGWNRTTLSVTASNGATNITVANATGAQAGGSIVIHSNIGYVDDLCSEGAYSYIPLDITAVNGNVISVSQNSNPYAAYSVVLTTDLSQLSTAQKEQYRRIYFYTFDTSGTTVTMWGRKQNKSYLEALSFVSAVTIISNPGILGYTNPIPIGTVVDIYPPGWPPNAIGGYPRAQYGGDPIMVGPSICCIMGVATAVYDDINHKHLYFIPRRDLERIEVWAYDLGTHTWEHKSSSSDMESHREQDLLAVWMHQNNAVAIIDEGFKSGTGVSTMVKYYRYATGSVTIEHPDNLAATVNSNNISLSWDAVSRATGYYVYRANRARGMDPGGLTYTKVASGGCSGLINGTTCTDATVASDKAYHYRVTAYNGSVESDLSLVARGVPKLIWDGYVSVNNTTSQTVNWVPRDTNVNGYNVYRASCTPTYYAYGTYSVSSGWEQYSGNVYRRLISNETGDFYGGYILKAMMDVTTGAPFTKVSTISGINGPYKCILFGNYLYANINSQSPPTDTVSYALGAISQDFLYTTRVLRMCNPGTFVKLNSELITGTSYSDTADMRGTMQYAYRVTSVNKLGIESGPSPYWITVPRAPRHLSWKQVTNGNYYDVKLKWDANPEAGIQGYNIYRKSGNTTDANGNYLTQVNTSLVTSTSYTHTQGVATSQANVGYYVVAVDALGQEGVPSSRAFINQSHLDFLIGYGYLADYNSGIDMGVINLGTTQPRIPVGPRTLPP